MYGIFPVLIYKHEVLFFDFSSMWILCIGAN